MGVAHFVILAINRGLTGKPRRIDNDKFACAVAISGFLACVLLSWVAAICDDSSAASCRGNGNIHDFIAVTFFILYNFSMIATSFSKPDTSSSLTKGSDFSDALMQAFAVWSLVTKLRFVPGASKALLEGGVQVDGTQDQTVLAIIEWSDVAVIIFWTAGFISKNAPTVRVGLCSISADSAAGASAWQQTFRTAFLEDGRKEVGPNADRAAKKAASQEMSGYTSIVFFSLKFLSTIAIVWFFAGLILCLGFYVLEGRLPAGHVPYISDLWVYPPGDWISRNMVVGGSMCAIIAHLCFYFAGDSGGSTSAPTKGQIGLASLALLGLSVVGVVDEDENDTVHTIAAVVFFAGYDLFMAWSLLTILSAEGLTKRSFLSFVTCLGSVLTKARFFRAGGLLGGADGVAGFPEDLPQMLEWADAIFLICFFIIDCQRHKAVSDDIGVLVWRPSA